MDFIDDYKCLLSFLLINGSLFILGIMFNLPELFLLIGNIMLFLLFKEELHTNKISNNKTYLFYIPLMMLIALFVRFCLILTNNDSLNQLIMINYNGILNFINCVIFAPIIEELVFRKTLFEILRKKIGTFFAIILSSIIFGLLHGNNALFAFIMGVLLCVLYHFKNDIDLNITIHSYINCMSIFGPAVFLFVPLALLYKRILNKKIILGD